MICASQASEEPVKQFAVLVRPRRGDLECIVVRARDGQTRCDLEEDHNAHFETSFAEYDEAEAYRRKYHYLNDAVAVGS